MTRGVVVGGGYTIIETMIFLAITGFLFVAAITAVSGRQATVQFAQGTRDMQADIERIINQVSTGYYPGGNLVCTVGAGAASPPVISTGADQQGSSNNCVFIGKALQLGTAPDHNHYNAISLAARRTTVSASGKIQEVSSLKEAIPTAVTGRNDTYTLNYGLAVTKVYISGSPATYGSIVFLSTLPKFEGATGTLASGAQRVSFGAIPGTTLDDDDSQVTAKVSNITDPTDSTPGIRTPIVVNPITGIVICVADDKDPARITRRATITIGAGASQASAVLKTIVPGEVTECP